MRGFHSLDSIEYYKCTRARRLLKRFPITPKNQKLSSDKM